MSRGCLYTKRLGESREGSGKDINKYCTINEYEMEDECVNTIGSDGWNTEGPIGR